MPKVGDIEDGYQFTGGDPSQPKNWMPVSAKPEKVAPRASLPSLQGGVTAARAAFPPQLVEKVHSLGEIVAPAILPTAGSVALPAAISAIPGVGEINAPLIPLEQGMGGVAGTYLNKLLGISAPSAADYALAGGLPVAAGYAGHVAHALKPFLPISTAAETMQPLAHMEALNAIEGLRTGQRASQLFQQATAEKIPIPLFKTRTAIDEMRAVLPDATPAARSAFDSVMKQTGMETLVKNGGVVTPAQMQNLLADIGKLEAKYAKEGGLKASQLGRLFSSLSDDLDEAAKAGGEINARMASGATTLQQARDVFKRETVLNEIKQSINTAFRLNAGQDVEKFSPNRIVNALQDKEGRLGKFFVQAFTPAEQKDTVELFKFLNTIPGLSPPSNVAAGSLKVMRGALVGGSAGMAVGTATGMNPAITAPIGTAIGVIGGPAVDISETIWQAWKMHGGKQLIKSLLKNSDGALTPKVMGALGAFVAGEMSTRPSPAIMPSHELPRAFENQP